MKGVCLGSCLLTYLVTMTIHIQTVVTITGAVLLFSRCFLCTQRTCTPSSLMRASNQFLISSQMANE